MKAFIFAIGLIVLIGFGYPVLNEDTWSLCSALERHLISHEHDSDQSNKIILGFLQSSLSNGSLVRVALKQLHPYMPVSLICGLTYWRVMIDPDYVERLKADARRELNAEERAKEFEKAMRALSSPSASGPASQPSPPARQPYPAEPLPSATAKPMPMQPSVTAAPTTAFDGKYIGVSRDSSKTASAPGTECPPPNVLPAPLTITNGVILGWWQGTVTPQGAIIMRNPKFSRVDAQIGRDGTVKGQYGDSACTVTFVWRKRSG